MIIDFEAERYDPLIHNYNVKKYNVFHFLIMMLVTWYSSKHAVYAVRNITSMPTYHKVVNVLEIRIQKRKPCNQNSQEKGE